MRKVPAQKKPRPLNEGARYRVEEIEYRPKEGTRSYVLVPIGVYPGRDLRIGDVLGPAPEFERGDLDG